MVKYFKRRGGLSLNKFLIPLFFLGVIVVGIGLLIVTFLLGMKPDKDKEEQVRIQAEQYLEDNFNENFEVYDTLFDNMGNFDFEYAAKVREKKTNTQFLVYYDEETKQMVDTYIADKWADDLKTEISPFIKLNFGETTDFHVFFNNETIGNELGIDPLILKVIQSLMLLLLSELLFLEKRATRTKNSLMNSYLSFKAKGN